MSNYYKPIDAIDGNMKNDKAYKMLEEYRAKIAAHNSKPNLDQAGQMKGASFVANSIFTGYNTTQNV